MGFLQPVKIDEENAYNTTNIDDIFGWTAVAFLVLFIAVNAFYLLPVKLYESYFAVRKIIKGIFNLFKEKQVKPKVKIRKVESFKNTGK